MKRLLHFATRMALVLSILILMVISANAAGAPTPINAAYEYDFFKLMNSRTTFYDFKELTSFSLTTIGDPDEIFKATSYCDFTDPFIFVEQGGTDANLRVADTAYCAMFSGGDGAYFTMKLRVREAGTYMLQNRAGCYSGGGEVEFYFAPDGTTNPMTTAYYVGKINTNASTANWLNVMDIAKITIGTPGDYIVVAKKLSASTSFATSGYILADLGSNDDTLGDATLYAYADKTTIAPTYSEGSYIHIVDAEMSPVYGPTTYTSENTDVITVDNTGKVSPVGLGKAKVNIEVYYQGSLYNLSVLFKVTEGKSAASFYSNERVSAYRENHKKYTWAQDSSTSNVTKANAYINSISDFYCLVTTQELPRSISLGYRWDPEMYKCRYCGLDITSKYGNYGWLLDPINNPWKVQCPDCRKQFPTNDFGSFYKLGIDEDGMWSYELAKSENAKLVAAGKSGYLVNTAYPEKGNGWGVDDGYGYHSGNYIKNSQGNTVESVWPFISYYNHWGLWYGSYGGTNAGIISKVIPTFIEAYLYTGDVKYAIPGALLIDRIADVYPDMNLEPYFPNFFNSDSTTPKGKMVGCIWQHGVSRDFVRGYDAFYDAYDDPRVIAEINKYASKYKMDVDKTSAVAIREHIEQNLILQTYTDIRKANIHGNFGMHQSLAAYVAVVYDTMPQTSEILDWIYKSSTDTFGADDISGGNVSAQLINLVDRDGLGAESGANYNALWISSMSSIFDALEGYDKCPDLNFFSHPRVKKMFKADLPLTLLRKTTVQIGDSGAVALDKYYMTTALLAQGFMQTGDVEMAQFLYHMLDGNLSGLHTSKWTKDPEAVQQKVRDVINKYGEYDFDSSTLLSGYGLGILRDGTYKSGSAAGTAGNTQRDMWMYFGGANSHKHADMLNLGMEAFGVTVIPDLGYPTASDGSDKIVYYETGSAIHTTVMVNEQNQNQMRSYYNGAARSNGRPLHFDDSENVKVLDVRAPSNTTSGGGEFRRSIVYIKVDEENSYGVDFFRVTGGNSHTYNFHALSNTIYATEGLSLTTQSGGTYAGKNVSFGTTGYKNGFAYLTNVRKSSSSTGNFAVDFKIQDFRSEGWGSKNIHLRTTMLNDFALEHVAIAKGAPPQRDSNPSELEFVFAKRSGTNLDSLFTAVYEPYKGSRYISNISSVSVSSNISCKAKAVKVTRTDGVTDYIVYCDNNNATLTVGNKFTFKGFVGVYSEKNGQVISTYGLDAEQVGNITGTAAYTGKVVDFTRELSTENYITIKFDDAIAPNNVIGRMIDIENGRSENGNVIIKGMTANLGNNTYKFDIGDASLVTSTVDLENLDAGYIYNAAVGNNVRIPLTLDQEDAVESYQWGQSVQVGLIEPWFLKANAIVHFGDENNPINYNSLKDYGAYFVRESELGRKDADQDNITIDEILSSPGVVKCSKLQNSAGIDGNMLTATYNKDLYTYEMDDSIFVLFYIEDATGIHYAPIRERNIKSLVAERKDDTVNFTNALERNVYSAMDTLKNDLDAYRRQYENLEQLPAHDAPTLASYTSENGAFTAETNFDYKFENSVQLVLVEPWGLKFNSKVSQKSNNSKLDYDTALEYGAIVFYDTENTVKNGMTKDELMSKQDAYVFSSKSGDAYEDGHFISAIYNKGIYTYQLDSNAYVMFYVKDANGYHYSDVKVRNAYDLAKERAEDTVHFPNEKERAVYASMVDMYDAITKYRNDYLKNK